MSAPGAGQQDRDLDVLLVDYQALRDDERAATASQAALASVFVALLAGLIVVLVGDCRFRGISDIAKARDAGSCYVLPDPVYLIAPALPFAVLAYIVMLGIQITIKSFYMRAIENEMRRYAPHPMTAIPQTLAASATELMLAVTSPRRGSRAYFALLFFVVITFGFALGGWVVFVAARIGVGARIGMFAIYAPLLVLIVHQGFLVNTGGRNCCGGLLRSSHPETIRTFPSSDLSALAGRRTSVRCGRTSFCRGPATPSNGFSCRRASESACGSVPGHRCRCSTSC